MGSGLLEKLCKEILVFVTGYKGWPNLTSRNTEVFLVIFGFQSADKCFSISYYICKYMCTYIYIYTHTTLMLKDYWLHD